MITSTDTDGVENHVIGVPQTETLGTTLFRQYPEPCKRMRPLQKEHTVKIFTRCSKEQLPTTFNVDWHQAMTDRHYNPTHSDSWNAVVPPWQHNVDVLHRSGDQLHMT